MRKFLLYVGLLLLITGCASSPERLASRHAEWAKESLLANDEKQLQSHLLLMIKMPTGPEKAKEFMDANPKAENVVALSFQNQINNISTTSGAIEIQENLNKMRTGGVIRHTMIDELSKNLSRHVAEINKNRLVPFSFNDNPEIFPDLMLKENIELIVFNSIKSLQNSQEAEGRRKNLQGLVNYYESDNSNPQSRQMIKNELRKLRIRKSELPLIKSIDSEYHNEINSSLTITVALDVKGGDRLFKDDLEKQILKDISGVKLVDADSSSQFKLLIERLREVERLDPPRTETITYRQHEINFIYRTWMMPKNASYMYDLVSGTSEMEYGYLISASDINQNKPQEIVVRGKVGGAYSNCQNPRIHNVFGGVQRAEFVANDDMARRCEATAEMSREELRGLALKELVSKIKTIDGIRAVHERNQ